MDYKILIADDEPEIRNLLRLYLENENYHVIEAEDGQRALDLLRAEAAGIMYFGYYDAEDRRLSCIAADSQRE